MRKVRKCKACRRSFEVNQSNQKRHSYCSGEACQRERRRRAQVLRRAQQLLQEEVKVRGAVNGRLHLPVKPTEADAMLEDPLFIGLISMLTDSTDLDDIRQVIRRLHDRGSSVLGPFASTVDIKTRSE